MAAVWVDPVVWEKRRPLRLQPHQSRLVTHEPFRYPFYIFWGMGSGKTIGGIACLRRLHPGQKALVLCDKSVVEQWVDEIKRVFGCNTSEYARLRVCVQHFEYLDDASGMSPRSFDMVLVDEAHRFRNAWDKESRRMLGWMARIRECPRVIYMSGTPIVHDADIEMRAFECMMTTDDGERDFARRISFYDPRDDAKRAMRYATVENHIVKCEMSWAQCFKYLVSRRQTFSIHLDGEGTPRTRLSSSRNTYNTLLRSICNCPFPGETGTSPKMQAMIKHLKEHEEGKQVVYSSRRDTGVLALLDEWVRVATHAKATFRIDGSMSREERADHIQRFNRCMNGALFITDAGAQGVDLKRVHVMHIMEPAENLQEERQVVNRAIRYNPHERGQSLVHVYRYVMEFPRRAAVAPPWKREIMASGLFDRDEMRGITRRVQYALLSLIRDEEHGETIDERIIRTRAVRDEDISRALDRLKRSCIEACAADDDKS